MDNISLTELNLENNAVRFGEEELAPIVTLVKKNSTLKSLDLSKNFLSGAALNWFQVQSQLTQLWCLEEQNTGKDPMSRKKIS